MWQSIIEAAMPTVVTVLASIATLLISYGGIKIRGWLKKLADKTNASEAERQAVEALMEGVEHSMETMVIDLKKSASDGKLSKQERAAALDSALTHAKTVAKGPGLEFLKTVSRERAGFMVKQLLAKVSKGKK